ncbi:MAG: 6-phosphofructokinase [Clostridiaceae bacterium]|nr:6-phosphofructokinase [Clostridiaceae bacterium]
MLKGNLMFGQSGGPTAVINCSAAGVFIEALKHQDRIEKVYGAHHGIIGVLEEDFFDMGQEDEEELLLLKQTPASALGSCRYKLADPDEDDTDYRRILEVFKKYNIRFFFYNGGNDSMDTCNKISKFMQENDYDCRVIGVPKTVDNDLYGTDFCPGYPSAARYIATTMMEVYCDSVVYPDGQITVVEIMGRNAGWLTAASVLAADKGSGPDLIYLPESVFDIDKFMADIKRIYDEKGKVLVAISEGVQTKDGKFIPELVGEVKVDAFGHKQMGGAAAVLKEYIENQINTKVRGIELSLMQRCAAHLASNVDVESTFNAGREAVKAALNDETDIMIGFKVNDSNDVELTHVPLEKAANTERKVPEEWINEEQNFVTDEFIDYCLPLVQGLPERKLEDNLPKFANLKFVQAGKK